jgi:hypothetical protein
MRKKGIYILLFVIAACVALRCTKPYNPTVIAGNNNYLVVEGNISTGTDSTTILLSRTTNLASGITTNPELGAKVTIQDNQSQSYGLADKGNGSYTSPILTLDPTRTYRLNIITTDGKTYLSDYVPATVSPPIDSIGFLVESNGIQLYVNTHDPNNNTHYYRWDYIETWEFRAKYESDYVSNGDSIVSRPPAQQIYKCWSSNLSNNIELGSSAKLTQDVIYQSPLVFVPSTSEKLEDRYSILLKQYAMTANGYNYYNLLKQNTEELGSIFDAQPSTLTGNIHCTTNAALPVIGYVTAGTVQQKRIYINNGQLPVNFVATYPYNCGDQDSAFFSDTRTIPKYQNTVLPLIPLVNAYVPTEAITAHNVIIGYEYAEHDCADCSIRGATTPPSFWVAGPYN